MKRYIITEEQLRKITEYFTISEKEDDDIFSNEITVKGRKCRINEDGTVSIQNNKKEFIKVRFQTKLPIYGAENANVVGLKIIEGGFKIKSKKGNKQDIKGQDVDDIISFVDTGKPNVIEGKIADLIMVKIVPKLQ